MSLAQERCRRFRKRILDISQQVQALHIGSAYSCTEIVDCIYFELMSRRDIFIMSKGHGCLIQYVILEELGILTADDLNLYCKSGGRLGCHPDYGVPGIAASTGSLGHGLSMAVGMAIANREYGTIYVVLSDGELQEGSTWEAIMVAGSMRLNNLIVFIDNNDFQSLERTSVSHPALYPIADKFIAFQWETMNVDGHDSSVLLNVVEQRRGECPFAVVAKTVKGKGVSYMENVPIWHYRSPNPEEYEQGLAELAS